MLPTKHDKRLVEVPGWENKLNPSECVDYNKVKTFIDLSEQMSSYAIPLRLKSMLIMRVFDSMRTIQRVSKTNNKIQRNSFV